MAENNESSKKKNTKKTTSETKKKTTRKKSTTEKAVTKAAKAVAKSNNTALQVIVVLLVVAIVALCVYGYFAGWFDFLFKKNPEIDFNAATYNVETIKDEDLSIHFLELGSWNTGDSIYIKAGETDILIDAGSVGASAETIAKYVDQYCEDGKLEYVIATHAHKDHIAGFVGTSAVKGIFERYKCDNIIEFTNNNGSDTYKKYAAARDKQKADGANVYTALQCWNNADGAKRTYQLSEGVTMDVLYQKYYEEKASTENNYSVCVMINQGDNHYLFTGDLEKGGEASLVENNNLPECVLYKAGHHGSKTSSNDVLLSVIKPQIVCVCCCAGTDEYTKTPENMFPTQEFVDRIAPYTDKVYVTTVGGENKTFSSMNGNIVFGCSYVAKQSGEVTTPDSGTTDDKTTESGTEAKNVEYEYKFSMYFTNNSDKLKDTDWFKNNRTCPDAWKSKDGN